MTTHRTRASALAAALVALATLPAAAQKPEPPLPPPLPLEPVEFPPYQMRQLPNGASLVVVEHAEQPVVSITISMPGGAAVVPARKAGLADMATDLLDGGTTTRSAAELAEAKDFIGAFMGAGASSDWTNLSLTVTKEFLDQGLDLLADVLLNPTFPETELETLRRRLLTALQAQRAQPASLAQERFMAEVYGEHPYGRSPNPETVRGITRQDLVDYHRSWMRPENALVVVAGDISADDIARRLGQRLAGWAGDAPALPSFGEPPARSERVLYFVHKPATVQAVIRLGHTLPSATEADWATLDVANQILGGGSSSWLFKVLRAQKGYTYGAYSSAVERRDDGYFMATAEVRNEVADSALAELISLVDRLRREPPPAADLEQAKAFLTGSFPLRIETPQQVAGQLASTLLLGRDVEFLEDYRTRLGAVTAADVQRAARTHIHPERSVLVVVGDATQILEPLRPFADRVVVLDTEGQPLDLAAAAPKPSTRSYELANIVEGTYPYGVLFQGNEVGELTLEVSLGTREGIAVLSFEQRMATPGGTQTQAVTLDAATGAPLEGSMSAGPASATVEFAGGKATGALELPTGERSIDVALPEGTLVPPSDGVLLSVTDWSEPSFEVPLFVLGQGVATATFQVVGEESVEVGAGTFDAYKVEASGPTPSTIWVRKAYPHIVLKQEMKAQPIAIHLKQLP